MSGTPGPHAEGAGSRGGIGRRRSYRIEQRSSAPVDTVWPLVSEAGHWKEWTFLTRSEVEREGDPPPDGAGSVRRLTFLGTGSREQVVSWDPPHHLSYTILSGFPVRNYLADVTLQPDGEGTRILWTATYDEKFRGTGAVTAWFIRGLIGRFARGLARHAERVAGA